MTLPPSCFFNLSAVGSLPTLWDNSNIVESYSGVTTPLTFSFASYVYGRAVALISSIFMTYLISTILFRFILCLSWLLAFPRR